MECRKGRESVIQKTAWALEKAMCACGCDRKPETTNPLPDGWVWDSGEPDSQWVFCPESTAHIPRDEPVASYQPDAVAIEERAQKPVPPPDVDSWRIRRGAVDCYFIDSAQRERIVAAKRREDLEYIISAVLAHKEANR